MGVRLPALLHDMRVPQTSSANHARDRYHSLDYATSLAAAALILSHLVRGVLQGNA